MDIKRILFGLFSWTTLIEAHKPLSHKTANHYATALNKLRSNVHPPATNMQRISYNFEFQARADEVVDIMGPQWFYENSNQTDIRQGWNGYYVPTLRGPPDWGMGGHDTCKSMTEKCLFDNLSYRVNQNKHCYNFNACDSKDGSYDRFKSCDNGPSQTVAHTTCSFVFNYWPRFIMANTTEIACVMLGIGGPGDAFQNNSFWCWTRFKNPSNDQPYKPGPSGSDCKNGVSKKLCI